MYCSVLYFTVLLCCTALYCTALYCTWYCTVLYNNTAVHASCFLQHQPWRPVTCLSLFNLRHPGISHHPHPEGERFMYLPNALVLPIGQLFSSGGRSFLALSAAGHDGRPRVHYAQVWAPAGLRGACSGYLKSRNLASNRGIASRRATANQAHGKPTIFGKRRC